MKLPLVHERELAEKEDGAASAEGGERFADVAETEVVAMALGSGDLEGFAVFCAGFSAGSHSHDLHMSVAGVDPVDPPISHEQNPSQGQGSGWGSLAPRR